ncbi:MAG: hypothetical protein ACOCX4_05780 [Planctomycetota bacterium]
MRRAMLAALAAWTILFLAGADALRAGEGGGVGGFFRRLGRGDDGETRTPPPDAPVVKHTRFSIEYTVRDEGAGGAMLQKVELFVTTDLGRTWTNYGSDPDRQSPFVIEVPGDGVYGFALVSTDRAGNRERPPADGVYPEQVVIVDSSPPEGQFLSPVRREPMSEEGIEIAWTTRDAHSAEDGVDIHVSGDGGERWYLLKEDLSPEGRILWKPPRQRAPVYTFRLKVTDRAGNTAYIKAPGVALADTEPPQVAITGPRTAAGRDVEITYTATDAGSGVAWVELWTTADGGETWSKHARDEDATSPIPFTASDAAEVGFYLRAADRVGNANPAPDAGASPMLVLGFDTAAPVIRITEFAGGRRFLQGGSTVDIAWRAEDPNLEANTVTVSWSADGGQTWETLATERPAVGRYTWRVPRQPDRNLNNCLLRITALDTLGNQGQVETPQPFSIRSVAPRTETGEIVPIPGEGEGVPAEAAPEEEDVMPFPPSTGEEEAAPGTAEEPLGRTPHPSDLIEDDAAATPPARIEEVVVTVPGEDEAPVPAETPASTADREARRQEAIERLNRVEDERRRAAVAMTEEAERKRREAEARRRGDAVAAALEARRERERKAREEEEKRRAEILRQAEEDAARERDAAIAAARAEEEKADAERRAAEAAAAEEARRAEEAARREAEAREREAVAATATPPEEAAPAAGAAATPEAVQQATALARQGDEALADREAARAELLYRQAVQLNPQSPRAQVGLGRIARMRGKVDEAFQHYERAFASEPEHVPAYLEMGELSLAEARQASEDLARGQKVGADMEDIARVRERLARRLRDAERAFATAVKLDPQNKEAYDNLGETYYFKAVVAGDRGEKANALFDAQEAYMKGYGIGRPTYREAFRLGRIHFLREEYAAAERYLQEGVQVAPADKKPRECWWYLAEIAERQERPDDALHFWRKVRDTYDPQNPAEKAYYDEAVNRIDRIQTTTR